MLLSKSILSVNIGKQNKFTKYINGLSCHITTLQVNITGLTGRIMFDDAGERTNYSLQILGLRDVDGIVRLDKV